MSGLGALRPDRGAISIFTLAVAPGLFYMIGLAYDEGLRFDVHQSAVSIARELARAEAQCVDVPNYMATGIAGVTLQSDPNYQTNIAQSCAGPLLNAITNGISTGQAPPNATTAPTFPSGVTFTVNSITTSANGNTITVSVTITRPTLFLTSLGFQDSSTGQATVKLVTGVTDAGG